MIKLLPLLGNYVISPSFLSKLILDFITTY